MKIPVPSERLTCVAGWAFAVLVLVSVTWLAWQTKVAEVVLPKVAAVIPKPLLPVASKLARRRLALRDTLVYQRGFTSMPEDWSARETVYRDGQFAKGDPSQDWVYEGNLVLGVKADAETPGKYLAGHVRGPTFTDPYGFWEARVKFPTAPGVLAGWWLQADPPYDTPGHVEVDIAENYGNPNVHHTLWWREAGMAWGEYHQPEPHLVTDMGADEEQGQFHNYGCRVTPTGYTFYVDGVLVGGFAEGLLSAPVFPVFSLKVPDYVVADLDPASLVAARMKVAWVRKYAL